MKDLKVFQMNDCDWWADYSKEEARKNYLETLGEKDLSDPEGYIDNDFFDALSDKTLGKLFFRADDGNEKITFGERLNQLDKPQFFASTEC